MNRTSLTCFVGLSLTLTTVLLSGEQQRGAETNPSNQPTRAQSATQSPAVIPPPDPSPYTGEETRKYNQEYLETQRSLADSAQRTAEYTIWLVLIGMGIGVAEIAILAMQVLYTGKAAKQAARAANTAEQTLLLTERADLLLDSIGISTGNGKTLQYQTEIEVVFKNCGRTRAHVTELERAVLSIGDERQTQDHPKRRLIGAGDKLRVRFAHLTETFNAAAVDAVNSGAKMTLSASFTYTTVFRNTHRTSIEAVFDHRIGDFRITKSEAD